jgi:dTMP kinase
MRGIFVTFEGIEGCGKSTQLAMLADWLAERERETVVTREPGGTVIGEKIRELLKAGTRNDIFSIRAEILLFEASRAQHMEEVILPAIEAGKCVLCDRFFDSTVVYQGAARAIDDNIVKFFNEFASYGHSPDMTIFQDISVDESFRRIALRHNGKDRIEQESQDFFEKVRRGYLLLAQSNSRFFMVDGGGDIVTIHRKIADEFAKRFF